MITRKVTTTRGQAILPNLYSNVFKTKTGRIIQFNASQYVNRYEYSDDNGITWNAMSFGYVLFAPQLSNSIQLQSGRIYVYDTKPQYPGAPRILYSDDNGDTWNDTPNAKAIIGSTRIQGMFLISTGTIIIITEYGVVYTDDEFNSCFSSNFIRNGQQSSIVNINTACFKELTSGRLMLGANDVSNSRILYYSDDQGKTWKLNNQVNRQINNIVETAPNKLMLLISRADVSSEVLPSEIWQSDDNGNTWIKLYTFAYSYDITSFIYLASKQMYIVKFNNTVTNAIGLLYSSDGCNTWDVLIPENNNTSDTMYPYNIKNENGELAISRIYDFRSMQQFYIINIMIETKYPKYLDQNGAQEIVTQFKTYCDSLVGGV